ncbi:unnamed protein product [Urochloa decumbens]|uniref:Uncharacterized protein n=1 Tax=Urochloa decumbens TaxID=240449 RepID=A0ABC9C148_9POAL
MADSHAVDIESLARQLREDMAAADSPPAPLATGFPIVIAQVGELTRNVDPAEYVPQHVAIGPYHRTTDSPHLARDGEKLRCLAAVMSAATAGMTLEVYLDELARIEARARSCYAHTFEHLDGAEFVRMLLLDACYLLVRFARLAARRWNAGVASGGGGGSQALAAAGGAMEAVAVVRDALYLAENQIPFFVVDKVHRLTVPDTAESAADAIASYVRELLRRQQYSVATPAVAAPPGPGNLLHLLHLHLTPVVLSPPAVTVAGGSGKRRFGRWRTATEYHCAGVGFRPRPLGGKGGARSILDVRLDARAGALEIPHLNIDAETWRLLRNLMALEQSNPSAAGSHVTAYCVFVSQLACTPRDVELLSRRGVIAHGMGSHGEVAELFADLCKGVVFGADGNYLHATWLAMEGRFRSRPRRWAAWLMLKYFSNPWLAVGLAAAAAGLVCTVVQAVFSVLSYTPGGT